MQEVDSAILFTPLARYAQHLTKPLTDFLNLHHQRDLHHTSKKFCSGRSVCLTISRKFCAVTHRCTHTCHKPSRLRRPPHPREMDDSSGCVSFVTRSSEQKIQHSFDSSEESLANFHITQYAQWYKPCKLPYSICAPKVE